jgi:hypothetical protein
MDELLRFLQTYEIWIYSILGIFSIIFIGRLFKGIINWRAAIYGLEREYARREFTSALTMLIIFLLLAMTEFGLVSFIVPAYAAGKVSLPTPTIELITTQSRTLTVNEVFSGSATVMPSPVSILAEGCVPGQIEWTFPENGGEIQGKVELRGTVNVPNLGFFKYEYSQPDSSEWLTIAADNENQKIDAVLGVWDTSQMVPGDYRLRLVVADNQNQLMPACVVSVRVIAP